MKSRYTFQHTPPGLAVADLQMLAFEFEGAGLVRAGELRRQASLDMMSDHVLLFVDGVGAELRDIGGVSGEAMLG